MNSPIRAGVDPLWKNVLEKILSYSTSRNILTRPVQVQYEHKMKLPLNMIRKRVLLYLRLPDYMVKSLHRSVATY